MKKVCFILLFVGGLLGWNSFAFSQEGLHYQAIEVNNGGKMSGKVTFSGEAPKLKALVVTKDVKVCGKEAKYDESLIVAGENQGLMNVVVSIKNISKGRAWPADTDPQSLDQDGCRFNPHVIVVPQKEKFNILNSDGVLHNIHTYSEANIPINKAQPKFLKKMSVSFEQTEYVRVNCDVHNWMQGWIAVAAHPYYAVSDKNGSFAIADIPAGKYMVEFWHEKLGKQTKEITIAAGGEAQLDTQFALK